jgi:hypothetical protein
MGVFVVIESGRAPSHIPTKPHSVEMYPKFCFAGHDALLLRTFCFGIQRHVALSRSVPGMEPYKPTHRWKLGDGSCQALPGAPDGKQRVRTNSGLERDIDIETFERFWEPIPGASAVPDEYAQYEATARELLALIAYDHADDPQNLNESMQALTSVLAAFYGRGFAAGVLQERERWNRDVIDM